MILERVVESGLVPDPLLRFGMRRLLKRRLDQEQAGGAEARKEAWIEALRQGPIATHTDAANEQHYEVPAAFYGFVLGAHRKYSCCYYETGQESLDEAEARMLEITARRADIQDRQTILDLGCGWGSFSLWAAARYPNAQILAVSNSASQGAFIMSEARRHGLDNLRHQKADMRSFDAGRRFDRIVSVEMFEHMRNYEALMERVATWLAPTGRLFVHVFVHKQYAYPFAEEGATNWMSRNFFSGGQMPSDDLLPRFAAPLQVANHWRVNGRHYAQTARHWLENLDEHRDEVLGLFQQDLGRAEAWRKLHAWRTFFMACEELWGYAGGEEWFVSHYAFE